VTVPTSAAELKIFLLAPAPKTSSATMTFSYQVYGNRKEPEPLFVILAPAPGGNLITAPRLQLRNTVQQPRLNNLMFQVACSLLCIPASSTPSERLFSQAGLLSSHRFSRTTPKNLELRLLAKLNAKKDWNSFILSLFFWLWAVSDMA
jgi:hypothetical protein